MTAAILNVGQRLKGRLSVYTITKQVYESVWLARSVTNHVPARIQKLTIPQHSDAGSQTVVIKSIRHARLENERHILKLFQNDRLRRLIDEVEHPGDPPALVLKYYDCHVGEVTNKAELSPREARFVARSVLEGLAVLHENGYVHSGPSIDLPTTFGSTLTNGSMYKKRCEAGQYSGQPL
jgi:serine/threonine protein kinase